MAIIYEILDTLVVYPCLLRGGGGAYYVAQYRYTGDLIHAYYVTQYRYTGDLIHAYYVAQYRYTGDLIHAYYVTQYRYTGSVSMPIT